MTLEIVARVDAWLTANVSPKNPVDVGAMLRALCVAWHDARSRWRLAIGPSRAADGCAMQGILLALVREAWGDASMHIRVEPSYDLGRFFRVITVGGKGMLVHGGRSWWATEDEALVAALEAAPRREAAP